MLLSISDIATSGQQVAGSVVKYNITNNVFIFSISGNATGRPACATDTRWVINPNSAQANAYKDAIILASTNNSTVEVGGTNTCDVSGVGNVESVGYIVIK